MSVASVREHKTAMSENCDPEHIEESSGTNEKSLQSPRLSNSVEGSPQLCRSVKDSPPLSVSVEGSPQLCRSTEGSLRSSCGSEDIMIRDRVSKGVTYFEPAEGKVNVTKCAKVHIGPEFRSVTQNVKNEKTDKDIPFYRYLWDVAKNTTKLERLSCVAAMLILITCIVLIIYYTVLDKTENEKDEDIDKEPPQWYVNRRQWGAVEYDPLATTKDHARLVIIAHSVTNECYTYINCVTAVQRIQAINLPDSDIAYNFLIGGDGRVYEGRGWNVRGAHSYGYNNCSVGIGFIGDYRTANVTDLQQERAHMLFEEGLKTGKLHPNFHVLGHLDLRPTLSPGENLYKVIQTWKRYDHENRYKSLNCQQIEDL